MNKLTNNRASILILTLWVMTFLSIFAVQIGLGIRQRIALVSRLEARSQLRFLCESGVKKAIALLVDEISKSPKKMTAKSKRALFNNPDHFQNVRLGEGVFNVVYEGEAEFLNKTGAYYGFIDEERKININTAKRYVLTQLLTRILEINDEEAGKKADAIIAWREVGETTLTGFSSDDYYSTLEFPYEPKDAFFENVDELALVESFDRDQVEILRPYITVYGDGRVNINTVPRIILESFGLGSSLVDKLDLVRRGADGIESTEDDFIFDRTFDIVSDMLVFVQLEADEIKSLEGLNNIGLIKTDSRFYTIAAVSDYRKLSLATRCVYNTLDNRVEYWREKY